MELQRRVRTSLARIFGIHVAKPSMLCWDVLASVDDRTFCGSGASTSTANFEHSLMIPKRIKSNHRDVARIVASHIAVTQVNISL